MSDFLFARPSFLGGAARVVDLLGTLLEYNNPPTPEIADQRAMFDDFQAIGTDLEQVIKRYEEAIAGGTVDKKASRQEKDSELSVSVILSSCRSEDTPRTLVDGGVAPCGISV